MQPLLLCLLVLLCFVQLLGERQGVRMKYETLDKEQMLGMVGGVHKQELPQNRFEIERQLSGTCVKTYQDSSSCVNCLNSTSVNATSGLSSSMGWCSDPSFCFDASYSLNVIACSDKCNGDVYYSGDNDYESECANSDLSLTSIVLIFIIVIVCPVCLVGSCIAFLCYRCHRAVGNKIAIDRIHDNDLVNTVAPVPVLSVYDGFSNATVSYPMTAVATIQEAPVVNLDEINGFKSSAISSGNRNSSKTGSGGSNRQYSAFAVVNSNSSSRYEAHLDP